MSYTHTHTSVYQIRFYFDETNKHLVSKYICLAGVQPCAERVKHTMLQEASCSVGGNVNWYNHYEGQDGGFLQNYVYSYPMTH